MMDVTRFLREGSKFMAADRPDIWDVDNAFDTLSHMFSYLAGLDESGEIGTGGFVLQKFIDIDNGDISYYLQRKILEFIVFEDENETTVMDWSHSSHLSNIGLDVPDPSIDNDD